MGRCNIIEVPLCHFTESNSVQYSESSLGGFAKQEFHLNLSNASHSISELFFLFFFFNYPITIFINLTEILEGHTIVGHYN